MSSENPREESQEKWRTQLREELRKNPGAAINEAIEQATVLSEAIYQHLESCGYNEERISNTMNNSPDKSVLRGELNRELFKFMLVYQDIPELQKRIDALRKDLTTMRLEVIQSGAKFLEIKSKEKAVKPAEKEDLGWGKEIELSFEGLKRPAEAEEEDAENLDWGDQEMDLSNEADVQPPATKSPEEQFKELEQQFIELAETIKKQSDYFSAKREESKESPERFLHMEDTELRFKESTQAKDSMDAKTTTSPISDPISSSANTEGLAKNLDKLGEALDKLEEKRQAEPSHKPMLKVMKYLQDRQLEAPDQTPVSNTPTAPSSDSKKRKPDQ